MAASFEHGHCGDRHDEATAPGPDIMQLLNDLRAQIPRQNQHVVGFRALDRIRMEYGYARARGVTTVLVRASIAGVVEKVGADTAVVEQCIALSGGSVTHHPLAGAPGCNQEF